MATSITRQQFVQALKDHPDWREEVRVQILGEELMRLPVVFQAFVVNQERFNDEGREFRSNQEKFNDEMREFRSNQEKFNQEVLRRFDSMDHRLDNMDRRFDRMEHDSSWLKNFSTEYRAESHAYSICVAADCEPNRILTRAELNDIARSLTDLSITPGDRGSFASADMIIEADSSGEVVYIAVEVSYSADQRDRRRAARNAGYLTDVTGRRAIPALAGIRCDQELQTAIDHGEIIWFEIEEPR